MSRRKKSVTQLAIDNLIFRPTRRSTNKPKPIPPASQVISFDYVHGLLQAKWNRMRRTR